MRITDVVKCLESFAPKALQESYDNAGLIIGNASSECTGILIALDATEEVIAEAAQKKCNLLVTHHPLIFKGIKKITSQNYIERCVIAAIKNDIAVYSIHTNLDNVITGVNKTIADKLDLQNCKALLPKADTLIKLVTFAPDDKAEIIKNALFIAGAGSIGNYSECSFVVSGEGSFKAGENTKPYVGKKGKRHLEKETRIEVVLPAYEQEKIVHALKIAHPYEEVAYDVYPLNNFRDDIGSGLIGNLKYNISEEAFLKKIKQRFGLKVIKHTGFLNKKISKVAVCGGAGSFLISAAKAAGADIYITSDVKYHEFFDADKSIVIADIGHYESEQFTSDLLADFLRKEFPNFAVLKTGISTNPVYYFL